MSYFVLRIWVFRLIFLLILHLNLTKCVTMLGANARNDCNQNIGKLNQTYYQQINRESSVFYIIPIDVWSDSTALRFEASLDQGIPGKPKKGYNFLPPLLFTVAQNEEMSSFPLPFTFEKQRQFAKEFYLNAGRTLCTPEALGPASRTRNVTVRVTSSSVETVGFRFNLRSSKEELIADGASISFDITPTSPKYYKYSWTDATNVQVVRVLATSLDSTCSTMSVQGPYCPVHDEVTNIEFDGFWQTISTKGAMTIHKNDFPDGFVVVFVQHKDENRCNKRAVGVVNVKPGSMLEHLVSTEIRSKSITLSLQNKREWGTGQFIMALVIPVFISLGVIILTCILFQIRHNWLSEETEIAFRKEAKLQSVRPPEELNSLLYTRSDEAPDTANGNRESQYELQTIPIKLDLDRSNKINRRQQKIWEFRANLRLVTLQKKEHREVMKDSNRFYWTIIIVSIFYAIPVYQLIFHYLRVVNRTGEFDICYYNYLCSNRLWIFTDFNHFWSNISYVVFGFAFNFIVGRRERNLRLAQVGDLEIAQVDTEEPKGCCEMGSFIPERLISCCCAPLIHGKVDHGIPLHFGVYYAMGLALVMEGVLSAAYHLCPNQSNFQFDTCFMYVISVLTILKIYQFRHPVHIGANQTFAILAAFALISVIGLILEVYNEGRLVNVFRWSFIVFQFFATCVLSVRYYAVGYIKDSKGYAITGWSALLHLNQLPKTVQVDRLIFPTISIVLSTAVVIYCELGEIHFATYLLYTLIANVLGSCVYYIGIMKPLHGEFKNRTWIQPAFYFLASVGIGTVAIYYFLTELTKWELTPSQSRAVNEECSYSWFPFLPLYDTHDCWHFYSAMALFFAFMGLLIVDDDLLTTPQSEIPIF